MLFSVPLYYISIYWNSRTLSGFAIDQEDEKGNTLLLVACQNSNKKMMEMLLLRSVESNNIISNFNFNFSSGNNI